MKHQRKFGFLLVLLLISMAMPQLEAAQVTGLYETEIPVMGQARDERSQALARAMETVLARISGRGDVAMLPGIENQLPLAQRYIQQFRYQKLEQPVIESVSGDETTHALWVLFNEKAINQLLHSNNLPVWGKNRPAVLVWLVVDDRKKRYLISNDSTHPVRAMVEKLAIDRGIPVRFPLLDLTDRASVSISDVWGNFEDTLLAASKRYQAEAMLVGRVNQDYSGNWNGRWTLYNQGRREEWNSSHENLVEGIAPGVNQTTDLLALQYAHVQQVGESSDVKVEVSAINGLADFNKVSDYLLSLTTITSVQPVQIENDKVTFQLVTRSGRGGLEQSISLGSVLVEETPPQPVVPAKPEAQPVVADILRYRYIK